MLKTDFEERLAQAKSDRRYLLEHIDERVLSILRRRFGTRKPVFRRGKDGRYDHDQALINDSYREVVLWLEDQLTLAKKENNQ